jgi:hypothetical protein
MGSEYLWLKSSTGLKKGNSRGGGAFWPGTEQEEAADGVRWFGHHDGDGGGRPDFLFMDDGYTFFQEGYIQDFDLRQFDITETYEDDFFNLWVGTWGLGGGVADVKSSFLELIPFGLFTSEVDAMAWDDEGMWIAGRHSPDDPGGITWWNMDREAWDYFEAPFITSLRSDIVNAIVADTTFVWFGTVEGLARYDKDRDAWRMFGIHNNLWDNDVTSVALGRNKLWIGTASGINRIQLPGMSIEQVRDKRLIHRYIHHLEVDGDDVWTGTDRGLFHFIAETNQWEYVPGYAGMVDLEVTAVSVWNHEVWMGTDDGIQMLDERTNQWRGFPAMHYPTGGMIHNILADSGDVWFGMEEGVLKFHKRENRWRRFTVQDGLADDSVRWILLDGDYVWFGTSRGLTKFYWNAPHRID